MDNVSRPLIALLLGTVAFFALWLVAFKPSTSKDGTTTSANYQPAINAARRAVSSSNALSAAQAAASVSATSPSASSNQLSAVAPRGLAAAAPPHRATTVTSSTTKAQVTLPQTTKHQRMALRALTARLITAAERQRAVAAALRTGRTLALLFYNPTGADDRAVRQELAAVPTHGRRVVKLAIPLSEIGHYSEVTDQVIVNQSPTLVLIDRTRTASTIVGFSDRFEIAQRVDDALAVGRST